MSDRSKGYFDKTQRVAAVGQPFLSAGKHKFRRPLARATPTGQPCNWADFFKVIIQIVNAKSSL